MLRDAAGTVVFVWLRQLIRDDGRHGLHCTLFRNESERLSSEIILEAESLAIARWGQRTAYTFVDSRKVRSCNPGACFKHAGWVSAGLTAGNKRPCKHVLTKVLRP